MSLKKRQLDYAIVVLRGSVGVYRSNVSNVVKCNNGTIHKWISYLIMIGISLIDVIKEKAIRLCNCLLAK
jgi:hypothetical protein